MITFKSLLDKVDFELVWKNYVYFYPDLEHLKDEYLQIYKSLLVKEPNRNEEGMVVHIDQQENEENANDIEYRVHGKNSSNEWDGYWDISSSAWGDWLDFYINDEVFVCLSNEEVIALCLYEMTWFDITESEVMNKVNNLGANEE